MSQGAVLVGLSRSRVVDAPGWRAGRRRFEVRTFVAMIGVVSAVALAGCTDPSPPPGPSPSITAAPASPSPTPTPEAIVPPERPAEWERGDNVGAAAAAVYFVELFDYVMHSGDLEEWNRVSIQDCGFCANVRADVEEVFGSGGRYTGGELELGEPTVVGFDETLRVHAVQLEYHSAPATVRDASDDVVERIDSGDGYLVLDVGFYGSGWQLLSGGARDEPVAS